MSDIQKLAASPVPFERISLPPDLDGSTGRNRNHAGLLKQIDADNDLEAVGVWLKEFDGSPNTQRAYRKEIERLILWSVHERGKPMSGLLREDFLAYEDFLVDPQPKARWCGPRATRFSESWRPFKSGLSNASVRQALVIINSLFGYLVAAGYLAGNPLALHKTGTRKTTSKKTNVERFLEQELWKEVLEYIESMPRETDRDIATYERLIYITTLFYLAGPRISEVVSHNMGDIFQKRGKWWWKVTGKGKKTETIPVNSELLGAISRYRLHLGLKSTPKPGEDTPLVLSIKGNRRISANMVYRIIKEIFVKTADRIEPNTPHQAEKLRKASTHWLRHTAITHQADSGIELRYLNKSARHSKIETTALYLHADEDKWHDAMEAHRLNKQPDSE